jgi:transcriptional regulator with XRE-family HTH domain
MSRRRYKRKPHRPISHEAFRRIRFLARLTQEETACLLHVTARTVAFWESGQVSIPYAAFKLLRILTGYALPGAAWKGWTIRGDTLWSPEGRGYNAGYLAYNWLTFAMAESWRKSPRTRQPGLGAQRRPGLRLVMGGLPSSLPNQGNPGEDEPPGQELA